jgi:hypothetical protein
MLLRRRSPACRAVAALAVAAALLLPGAVPAGALPSGAAVPAGAVPGPVVLVGTGGVRWSSTGAATPALSGLREGAVGLLSVRSVRTSTCSVDGWLAVSAGARAADEAEPCRAPAFVTPPAPGGPAGVQRWDVYRRLADAAPDDARPGLLGDTLGAALVRTAAVGPGAAIALAGSDGRVPAAWPGLPTRTGGSVNAGTTGASPSADTDELRRQVDAALATRPGLLAVDVGGVRAGTGDVGAQLRVVDARVGAVLAALPANATVVVASLADAAGQARLQLAAASGPAPGATTYRGYLRSGSTRQAGLAQATDILPTLTSALGLPTPHGAVGSPIVPVGAAESAAARAGHLADLAAPAETIDPIVAPFFVLTLTLEFLLYLGALGLRARRRREGLGTARLDAGTAALAVAFALVPAGTFAANLWPWWRATQPALALAAAVAGAALVLAAVALAGPWRRALTGPAGAAGALTALVLTADVATGSRLSLTALIGGQPLVGGRFYGFSNPGFALFATGTLFATVALADPLVRAGRPRAAAGTVAAIGIVATAVDGLPGLGSDFGGPPALVPAFAYLTLRVAGVRLTWRRAVAVLAGTLAVLAVLAVGDWLRPPDRRSHLGRFVQTVLDGGGWDIVTRKLDQNLGIVTSSPVQLVLPLVAVVVGVALARPRRWHLEPLAVAYQRSPTLRPALAALAVLLVAGFAVNDSGAAIPPVAAMLALPLLLAVGIRAEASADPGALRPAPAQDRDDDGREQDRRHVTT